MSDRGPLPIWRISPEQDGPVRARIDAVGSKAFNLMRMAAVGLPVPPGFVLGTALCREYFGRGGRFPDGFDALLRREMMALEEVTGLRFGDRRRPLIVAVRAGAAVSMPGMLETVLNVGVNETTTHGLIRSTGNPRLAWDCRRRFLESFASVVMRVPRHEIGQLLDLRLATEDLANPRQLDAAGHRDVSRAVVDLVARTTGRSFPEDPFQQLTMAVEAVLGSWNSPRAVSYRRMNGIDDLAGTAVTVQAMVFGNAGPTSGAGVGFTRNPSTGQDELYVDFLLNAQGEDVVSGRHRVTSTRELRDFVPLADEELNRVRQVLETEFGDMQDFEFTIQEGRLFLLQTRAGQRTAWAALQIAVDLVRSGIIDSARGLELLAPYTLGDIERTQLDVRDGQTAVALATPASLGVATGAIAFDHDAVDRLTAAGNPVILVREEMQTEDLDALAAASGILSARGAKTSHAALLARQLGKVCLVGLGELEIDLAHRRCRIGNHSYREGDTLTLDGSSGAIFDGAVTMLHERPHELLSEVERWRRAASPQSEPESCPKRPG